MNKHNRLIIGLGMAMFVSVINSMKRPYEAEANDEVTSYFKQLPQELQQDIRRLQLLHNAVIFLGMYPPITLEGHTGPINSVATNGSKVITGSSDNTAKIWDRKTGQLLHTLTGHTHPIFSVAINDNNIITGSVGDTVRIWDINTGQPLLTLEGYSAPKETEAISGNKKVVISQEETIATIRDRYSNNLQHTLVGHEEEINSVAVSGNKIVTGSDDNTAKIWDVNTGQLLHTLIGHTKFVITVAISNDKTVTGSMDETAKIWDVNTGRLLYTLKGHRDDVISVTMHDATVVTGSDDNTAKIWSLSPNLQGTAETNPLVWIIYHATIPQADFIKRAYESTIVEQDLIIVMPQRALGPIQEGDTQAQIDGNIYFSFPVTIREYLRDRLNIRQ